MYYGIHHVQLAMPPGAEDAARTFFIGVLGLTELTKPPGLAARGGAWFRGPGEWGVEFHLGVEPDFAAARKAHPGIVWGDPAALTGLADRLASAGHPVTWDRELDGVTMHLNGGTPPPIPRHDAGMHRLYTVDPFGNRLEFLAPIEAP